MAEAVRKKVFISYSWDSDSHADRVLSLADALNGNGLDATIDQYETPPPTDWTHWMENHLSSADYILMVCTEPYYRRVMQKEKPGKGHGARWEGTIIYNLIYHSDASVANRFIPILLEGGLLDHVPLPIKSHHRYELTGFELSDSSFESLLRHLLDQPLTPKPEPGPTPVLPPRPRGNHSVNP